MPLLRRTLAILRRAELGFLGVAVLTDVQTPRFCGLDASDCLRFNVLSDFCSAGAVDFFTFVCLPFLTNWLNVGIIHLPEICDKFAFCLKSSSKIAPFHGTVKQFTTAWRKSQGLYQFIFQAGTLVKIAAFPQKFLARDFQRVRDFKQCVDGRANFPIASMIYTGHKFSDVSMANSQDFRKGPQAELSFLGNFYE